MRARCRVRRGYLLYFIQLHTCFVEPLRWDLGRGEQTFSAGSGFRSVFSALATILVGTPIFSTVFFFQSLSDKYRTKEVVGKLQCKYLTESAEAVRLSRMFSKETFVSKSFDKRRYLHKYG